MLSPVDKFETWRQTDSDDLELCIMGPDGNHESIDEDIILEDLKVSFHLEFAMIKKIHENETNFTPFRFFQILATMWNLM